MPILVVEVLAIRTALKHAIQGKNSSVIIESDSHITIQAINGKTLPPFLISDLVEYIKNLARHIDNISFVFCKRCANTWKIGSLKCILMLVLSIVAINNNISLVIVKKKSCYLR